jgi:hypothetical protein
MALSNIRYVRVFFVRSRAAGEGKGIEGMRLEVIEREAERDWEGREGDGECEFGAARTERRT